MPPQKARPKVMCHVAHVRLGQLRSQNREQMVGATSEARAPTLHARFRHAVLCLNQGAGFTDHSDGRQDRSGVSVHMEHGYAT